MNTIRKTGRTILNALAFSNVSNLGELRAQLRQIDAPADPDRVPASHEATPQASGNSVGAPALRLVQGAL